MYRNIDEKKYQFYSICEILQFLVVKYMDPDPRWPKMLGSGSGTGSTTLDPDPD